MPDARRLRIDLGLATRIGDCNFAGMVERRRWLRDQKFYASDVSRSRCDQTIKNIANLIDLVNFHPDSMGDAVTHKFRIRARLLA